MFQIIKHGIETVATRIQFSSVYDPEIGEIFILTDKFALELIKDGHSQKYITSLIGKRVQFLPVKVGNQELKALDEAEDS